MVLEPSPVSVDWARPNQSQILFSSIEIFKQRKSCLLEPSRRVRARVTCLSLWPGPNWKEETRYILLYQFLITRSRPEEEVWLFPISAQGQKQIRVKKIIHPNSWPHISAFVRRWNMTERKSIFQERFTVFEICWDDIIVSGGVFLVILHSLLDKTSVWISSCVELAQMSAGALMYENLMLGWRLRV